jgi:outer membrane protein OmpA-like peptidoglycan-associated protein
VNLNVQLPNMTSINASDTIYYDKSIITQFDAAGTTAMLNIEFETGSAKLSESSREYIIQVYEVMRNTPGIKIAIHGHTDDVGAEEDNLILSKERAKSVRDALISLGIEQNRLFTKGFGESQPLVPNDSDKNRKLNRRTEFVVLENE